MCSMEKETEIKKVLRNWCMNYGWSFGVFWRFNQRNSMLLTLEEAYSEDYATSLTDNMLLQVHMLGEGVIGQAAFDGNHRWVHENNCDFSCEFSYGIKTMAVIPVESCGVLQLGSIHKMLETPGFVDQAQQIIRELGLIDGLVPLGYNSLQTTNDSIPSSSCVEENQDCSFGFNPLSFLGGSVENQCLDSLLHGFDEFSSTEFPTTSLQEHDLDDSALQWLHSLPEPTHNDDLLQSLLPSSNAFETQFGNVKREETLEDILFPPPKKGLFSELGLDQLLSNRADSTSFANSTIEDPIFSPKKRKVEFYQESGKCFIADAKSCITDHTMRHQESSKATTKKRARPGESPRPRPKDRQMIQDRIKELRDMIPNGAKCSIDSLLDRTIKHMLFMQGVTKHVDKLQRVDEAKAQRDVSKNSENSGSAAWAVEVGGHNPIVVEDLGHSGQMLIEMVCEVQGFFLEIANVIRGFGLTILKGVVEAKDGKICAHFIVEANRHVTRMEVLMSLLQLLKESSTVGSKSVAQRNSVFDNKSTSLLNNYHHHQPMMSLR